jgi:hypothetical protein
MAKPTVKPDWALLDQVDPTSGKNNVVEPAAAFKNYGWPRKSRPARQYLNWLGRVVASWVEWLDAELSVDVTTLQSDLTTETSLRESADTTLQDNLDAEAVTRAGVDGTLQGNIDTEESARQGTDLVLSGLISDEVSDRSNADTAINNEIDAYDADTLDDSGIMKLTGFVADENVNFYAQYRRHRSSSVSPGLSYTEVILYLPEVLATSTTTSMTLNSADIPAALRPDTDNMFVPIVIQDNSTTQLGFLQITTAGDWNFYKADGTAIFTASGQKGIMRQVIKYRKLLA